MSQSQDPKSLSDLLAQVPSVTDHLFRNAPKNALTIYTQMMPGDGVRPEFTTWRDEQQAWRTTVAVHDQSYHMQSLHVRGKDALAFTQYLSVNTFKNFGIGAAKQLVCCSPEGYLIGDAILYRMDEDDYMQRFMCVFNDTSKLAASAAYDLYDTARFSIIPKFFWLKISYATFALGNLIALVVAFSGM